MHAAIASASTTPKHGIAALAFRNKCGRRGCGHILEYDGPNPLENIQRLVHEHSPLCRGQRPEATDMFWRRSQQDSGQVSGQMEGRNIWDEYASFNPSQGGPSLPSSYGSTIDHSYIGLSEGGTSCTSPSSMGSLQGLPSSSGSFTGKKTARSEAERREALEADEWTLQVKPLQVVCRGCGRTIKLDRRSRYYPGLWEKHRNKCKHVREMQETMETEKPIPAKVSADDARPLMGGAPSSFPCGGSNPTILAPRRSYYRKI